MPLPSGAKARKAIGVPLNGVYEATGVPVLLLDGPAPDAVLDQWRAQRQAEGGAPSDATQEVIRAQQAGN
ncbi:hypothetical protein U8L64_00560 [Pseudomonas sp. FIP_A4]